MTKFCFDDIENLTAVCSQLMRNIVCIDVRHIQRRKMLSDYGFATAYASCESYP